MRSTWPSLVIGLVLFSIGTIKIVFFGDWSGLIQIAFGVLVLGLNGWVRIQMNKSQRY